MRFWTAHLRAGKTPILVREGFSWGAFFFGPLWLLVHRAYIPAVLALAAGVLIGGLTSGGEASALSVLLALALGFYGRDLVRFSLDRRGYTLAHLVAARDADAALARLLERRPDLAERYLPPHEAR